MIPTDPDKGPVERSDLVKGYEISKDHYVVVTQEEIDSVRVKRRAIGTPYRRAIGTPPFHPRISGEARSHQHAQSVAAG
jgi:hypothetical protein